MVEPKTPKLQGSFPATPTPQRQQARASGTAHAPQPGGQQSSRNVPPSASQGNQSIETEEVEPRIATNVVDAPTQRFYAVTIFLMLQAVKIADIAKLYTGDEGDSISELMFCVKWVAIDGLFFWFLPFMRIPWLTFSPSTTFLQIFCFFIINMAISFKYTVSVSRDSLRVKPKSTDPNNDAQFVPFSSLWYSIWKSMF